jgi:predicted GNAT superfamily acetyltransferase
MAPETSDIALRELDSPSDYQACLELQRATWGDAFEDAVPPIILRLSRKLGGVAAGAFAPGGELLGFVFGMTGLYQGELGHWSHLLAVRRDQRDQRLGYRLKLYQRELLLALGVRRMFWTFDPLVARNANLNLNRLGARVDSYHRDYYGTGENSVLFAGLGTDRFIVRWQLDSAWTAARLAGQPPEFPRGSEEAPIVGLGSVAQPGGGPVRIEIPADIHAEELAHPGAGARWRASSRAAFEAHLGAGYQIIGLLRGDGAETRRFYVLCSPSSE